MGFFQSLWSVLAEASWRSRISKGGWGLVTSSDTSPEIEAALEPLVARRRALLRSNVRVFSGADGFQPGESAREFVARHGGSLQAAPDDPVPQLLLLVGGPGSKAIPFRAQMDLATMRGVGRIVFDTADEYSRYARNVVQYEKQPDNAKPLLTLVAPTHAGDPVSTVWADRLVSQVQRALAEAGRVDVSTLVGDAANKNAVAGALTSPASSKVVLVAAHGVELRRGAPEQTACQGAIVCSDWQGPSDGNQVLARSQMFAADDVDAATDVAGQIVVAAGSFSAGTPTTDAFALYVLGRVATLAPAPFVAGLPRRMLALERGAVSWVGHADRVWAHAGPEGRAAAPLADAYANFFTRLLTGEPIGLAARIFGQRAAALRVPLEDLSDEITAREGQDARELAETWTAYRDLSSVIVLGDPAVRISQRPPWPAPSATPTAVR